MLGLGVMQRNGLLTRVLPALESIQEAATKQHTQQDSYERSEACSEKKHSGSTVLCE